jgi:hypothetical protein
VRTPHLRHVLDLQIHAQDLVEVGDGLHVGEHLLQLVDRDLLMRARARMD